MSNLIDDTYFKGVISLPVAQQDSANYDKLIADTQRDILIKALGYDLYKQFITAIEGGSPAQKWIDIKDGKEYNVEDSKGRTVLVKWPGLVNDEKISLLAYFSFYNILEYLNYKNNPTGTTKGKNENSIAAGNNIVNRRMSRAYNLGVELYGVDISYHSGERAILRGRKYRESISKFSQFDYYQEILKGTLYNMIYFANLETPDTYTNWNFTPIETINEFGI